MTKRSGNRSVLAIGAAVAALMAATSLGGWALAAPAPTDAAKPAAPAAAKAIAAPKGAAPAATATTAAQLFAGYAAQPSITRSVTLEDLGFKNPLVFNGAGSERELFFRVPRGIRLFDGQVVVEGTYLRSSGGRETFVTEIDGTPVSAQDFDSAEGVLGLTIPVKTISNDADFVRVGLKFSSIAFADRCQDNRSIGNLVTVTPGTRLSYRFDPREVSSVRAAWVLLPRKVRFLLPSEQLSPVQYDASLRLALAIRATGREVLFETMPAVGSTVSVADLQIPQQLKSIPVFRKFFDSPDMVQLDQPADRGAYEVVRALSGTGMGDVVLGDGWFKTTLGEDMTALKAEIAKENAETRDAFDRWLQRAMPPTEAADPDTNLKLEFGLGQPIIVLDTDKAGVGAELLANRWFNLARTSRLTVREADVDDTDVNWITLDHLNGGLGTQDIVDHGDWLLTFNAGMLPPGRWPSGVEVDFVVAPDSSNADPVYTISLNDTLLRADKIGEAGGIARATAEIPSYLLSANNKLTIGVQRGPLAQDCRYLPHGYSAQVLPTSRLLLSDLDLHEEFFGLHPLFARAGAVGIPKNYLATATASLEFVQTYLYALGFTPASLQLFVLQDPASFQPTKTFVAFDSAITATDSGAKLSQAGLILPDSSSTKRVDVKGVGDIALAQMATSNGQSGVLVTTAGGKTLPVIKLDSLDDGQVIVADSRGVVVQAGKTWRENGAISQAVNAPAEVGYRYKTWLIAGIVIIVLLVLMRLVRGIVDRRRRRQD